MAETHQSKIELVGDGSKVISELNRVEKGGRAFASSFKGVFANVNKYIDAATQHFGFFETAVTAFATGAVLKKLFSVADYIPLDTALLQMQANLHMNASEVKGLREQLSALAGKEGKDMGQIFAGGAKLSALYNPDEIEKIMRASAKVSDVMKEDLATSADMVVRIMKMYRQGADDAEDIADSLIASRAPLERMGIFFERGVMRGGASKDYKDIMALVGALQKSGISNPRIAGQVEATMNAIEKKAPFLKKYGIDVAGKSVDDILAAFEMRITKAKAQGRNDEGIAEWLDKYVAPGAGEALPFLIGQRDKVKKALEDQGNAATIAGERATKADMEWGKQLERVKGHLAGIKTDLGAVYDIAKRPVAWFANSPNLVKGAGYGAGALAMLIGGGVLYGKGRGFLKSIGGTAAGMAEGKAAEAVAGITPVFVTNWPGVLGAGSGAATAAGAGAGASLLKSLMPFVPVIAGAAAAAVFLEHAGQPEVKEESKRRAGIAEAVDERLRQATGRWANNINIYIDKDGRTRADPTGMNTQISVRSRSFAPLGMDYGN